MKRWGRVKRAKGKIAAVILPAVALAVFVFLLDATLGIGDATILIFVIVGWCSILERIDDLRCEVEEIKREELFDE